MSNLPGKDTSLWLDTTPKTSYPKLEEDAKFDVVIAGGGITGIMCGWILQREGLNTAIIEKNRIIENTTGNTTAKLTSQHYLLYHDLINEQGQETAQAYAAANETSIDEIEEIVKAHNIDCDFERTDAYVYTNDDKKVQEVKNEVTAAQRLGLPATYEPKIELPFDIKASIRFANQAQFHPRKFLLPLADDFSKKGGRIYENTEAKDIKPGLLSQTLVTADGKIEAKYVIEATKYPFWKPKIFEKVMWTKLSYALGVRIRGDYPRGMYITTDEPLRSIRSHPYKEGQLLIFGGDSHKMEKGYDKDEHYQNLVDDVTRSYEVEEILYRWIAGDAMPYDKMPYIGEYPEYKNIFVATGYRAWGLAWSVAAARIITGSILNRPLLWSKPFSPARLKF